MLKKFNLFDTVREVALIYVTVIVFAALAMGVIEGWTLLQAVWWAVVTATTTGYGDLYPKTMLGQVIAMIMMIGCMILNIVLGALLAAKLIVDNDAWTHAEQEQVKNQLAEVLEILKEK